MTRFFLSIFPAYVGAIIDKTSNLEQQFGVEMFAYDLMKSFKMSGQLQGAQGK
jgi:hypothetical protein